MSVLPAGRKHDITVFAEPFERHQRFVKYAVSATGYSTGRDIFMRRAY